MVSEACGNHVMCFIKTRIWDCTALTLNHCLLCRGELHQVAVEKWPVVNDDIRQMMARMAAAAAWGLGTIFFF